jgi:hypothetical protein
LGFNRLKNQQGNDRKQNFHLTVFHVNN